jgi:hypothetical protein
MSKASYMLVRQESQNYMYHSLSLRTEIEEELQIPPPA